MDDDNNDDDAGGDVLGLSVQRRRLAVKALYYHGLNCCLAVKDLNVSSLLTQ